MIYDLSECLVGFFMIISCLLRSTQAVRCYECNPNSPYSVSGSFSSSSSFSSGGSGIYSSSSSSNDCYNPDSRQIKDCPWDQTICYTAVLPGPQSTFSSSGSISGANSPANVGSPPNVAQSNQAQVVSRGCGRSPLVKPNEIGDDECKAITINPPPGVKQLTTNPISATICHCKSDGCNDKRIDQLPSSLYSSPANSAWTSMSGSSQWVSPYGSGSPYPGMSRDSSMGYGSPYSDNALNGNPQTPSLLYYPNGMPNLQNSGAFGGGPYYSQQPGLQPRAGSGSQNPAFTINSGGVNYATQGVQSTAYGPSPGMYGNSVGGASPTTGGGYYPPSSGFQGSQTPYDPRNQAGQPGSGFSNSGGFYGPNRPNDVNGGRYNPAGVVPRDGSLGTNGWALSDGQKATGASASPDSAGRNGPTGTIQYYVTSDRQSKYDLNGTYPQQQQSQFGTSGNQPFGNPYTSNQGLVVQRGCGKYPGVYDVGDEECRVVTLPGTSTRATVCNCRSDSCNSRRPDQVQTPLQSTGTAGTGFYPSGSNQPYPASGQYPQQPNMYGQGSLYGPNYGQGQGQGTYGTGYYGSPGQSSYPSYNQQGQAPNYGPNYGQQPYGQPGAFPGYAQQYPAQGQGVGQQPYYPNQYGQPGYDYQGRYGGASSSLSSPLIISVSTLIVFFVAFVGLP